MRQGERDVADPVLVYDGECRLCVAAKERLEPAAHAQGIRLVAYQTPEAAARLGSRYRPGRPDVAFLVEPDGTIRRGLEAFLPVLPALPGGTLLLRLMAIPLLRPLAHLLYAVVARYRYRFFGQVPCEGSCRHPAAGDDVTTGRSASAR